jgi:hypothetical protein
MGNPGPMQEKRDRSAASSSCSLTSFLVVGASLLLIVVLLYPMFRLGFIADDVMVSSLRGSLELQHISVWRIIGSQNAWWIANHGRFFPMSIIVGMGFFSLNPSMPIEKIVQLMAVLVNVITLFFVLRRLAGGQFAAIASLMFTVTLQIRYFVDPVVSFFILLPTIAESTLLALGCWMLSFDRRSLWFAALAVAIEVFALLSYEMSYALVLGVTACGLIMAPDRRRRVDVVIGTLAPLAILTLVDIILRSHVRASTYAIGSHADAYLSTFIGQLLAAIPLTYSIFSGAWNPHGAFLDFDVPTVLGFVLAFAAGYVGFIRFAPLEKRAECATLILGCAMWVFPAATISLSANTHTGIDIAHGYLNVYLEYFGVAIILALISFRLSHALPAGSRYSVVARIVAAFIFALAIKATATSDHQTMAQIYPVWTPERVAMNRAFDSGLARPLMDVQGTRVITNRQYPFSPEQYAGLLYQESGVRVPGGVVDLPSFSAAAICAGNQAKRSFCTASIPLWFLQIDPAGGHVQFAHLAAVNRSTLTPIVDRWLVSGEGLTPESINALPYKTLAGRGPDAVYALHNCLGSTLTDPVVDAPPSNVAFGKGFSIAEQSGADRWHWGEPKAEMTLTRTLGPVRGSIRFSLRALGVARVTISAPGTRRIVTLHNAAKTYITLPFDLRGATKTSIRFSSVGGPFSVPGDSRRLAIQVSDVAIQPICGSSAL